MRRKQQSLEKEDELHWAVLGSLRYFGGVQRMLCGSSTP